jgi:hypothetical protein
MEWLYLQLRNNWTIFRVGILVLTAGWIAGTVVFAAPDMQDQAQEPRPAFMHLILNCFRRKVM